MFLFWPASSNSQYCLGSQHPTVLAHLQCVHPLLVTRNRQSNGSLQTGQAHFATAMFVVQVVLDHCTQHCSTDFSRTCSQLRCLIRRSQTLHCMRLPRLATQTRSRAYWMVGLTLAKLTAGAKCLMMWLQISQSETPSEGQSAAPLQLFNACCRMVCYCSSFGAHPGRKRLLKLRVSCCTGSLSG